MKKDIAYYEAQGYLVERLDDSKLVWSVFTKDFKEGDTVYHLGHDGVFGCMYGWTYIADKEMVDKKDNLWFYKKITTIKKIMKKYIDRKQGAIGPPYKFYEFVVNGRQLNMKWILFKYNIVSAFYRLQKFLNLSK
jgi:hypothetical protein